ncbi:unnamed protein product, partial [Choristocarpus tenellus]
FYESYVSPRQPVVINGCPPESEGWHGGRWTNQYLQENAGEAKVRVEFRSASTEKFGEGRERTMKFGDFVREVSNRNDLLYLTTQQELGADPDGRPDLMSPPLTNLRGDFSLRPLLAGNLIPQNVNLWMGFSKEGSSSGLHHDFHDNLYILLRGRKMFR